MIHKNFHSNFPTFLSWFEIDAKKDLYEEFIIDKCSIYCESLRLKESWMSTSSSSRENEIWER